MKRRYKPMASSTIKPPSKKLLISELRTVYKTLASPFNLEEYDDTCSSKCKSDYVLEVFGTWEQALKEAGLLSKFSTHYTIQAEIETFDPSREVKKNWNKEKKKLVDSAEAKEVKSLKTKNHKVNLFEEMLDKALNRIEPLVVVGPPKKKVKKKKLSARAIKAQAAKPPGTLWFEFSDLQLGTLITKQELGGLNEHNWAIWQQKLNRWKNQAIEKITFYKNHYAIDRIIIACLGDMVEGQDIFKGQKWQIDQNVVDQALMGADDTAEAFADIFLAHPDVQFDIFEVFGNHGRVASKGESPYSCSMDKVYQRFLEARLDGVPELSNFKYHRNEAWFEFVEIYGWNHLLLHGDQGMNKLGPTRPTLDGLERGVARFNQMFQQQVHFIHCGHFHTAVNFSFNISQLLINGSFIGTSTFSACQLVASTPPVQLLYIFTPSNGLDITQRLYMDEKVIDPVLPKSLGDVKR